MYIPNVKSEELPRGMLREVYDCWDCLKKGETLPSRDDLISRPVISKHLPNLVLATIFHNPLDFKAQMVGSQTIAALGFNLTGSFASRLKLADEVFQRGRTLADKKEPYFSSAELKWAMNKDIHYDTLALPLSEDGETVKLVLLVMRFHKF
jgi:hypothetical protein